MQGARERFDVVIVDTAGRLQIDERMMGELQATQRAIKPSDTLLVVDAMTGQEAASLTKAFNDATELTGMISNLETSCFWALFWLGLLHAQSYLDLYVQLCLLVLVYQRISLYRSWSILAQLQVTSNASLLFCQPFVWAWSVMQTSMSGLGIIPT